MTLRTLLRVLVILQWCLAVGGSAVGDWERQGLIDVLAMTRRPLSSLSFLSAGIFLLSIALAIPSSIGVAFIKRWARPMYLASVVLASLGVGLGGVQVDTPIAEMMGEFATVIGGVVVGLIYFSDLRTEFSPRAV